MGQKIHPYGIRLGIQKSHHSNWFALKDQYSHQFFEDQYIRNFLYQTFSNAGILDIQIERKLNNHIHITINCSKANYFLNKKNTTLKEIQAKLQSHLSHQSDPPKLKIHKEPIKISIQVIECIKCEQNAAFLADFLIDQLEKRIAFRRALKKTLKRTEKLNLQGIKIQIAGRLNGAEIARTEWMREGRVPLQTLRAEIDYCHKTAQTIYGLLGIKIWIFLEKKYN